MEALLRLDTAGSCVQDTQEYASDLVYLIATTQKKPLL